MRIRDLLARRRAQSRARGAAIVEFAVVAPVLFLIVFGIIEYGYVFLVQQTLTNAAREGCRIAVLQSTTTDAPINARIDAILDAANVTQRTVTLTHATEADPTETVTIEVPYNSVSLTGFFGPRSYNLTGTTSMRKEGV